MVLPGWNVSEPIQLAVKLYEVIDDLKDAPEGAKAFVSKVNGFRRLLEELGQTLKSDFPESSSAKDLDHLHATLIECQDCVRRCQDFGDRFKSLTKDGGGGIARVGQAARYLWQDKKVARLRTEIDSQMNSIHLSLTVRTFTDSRSRQNSAPTSPSVFGSPRRAETSSSLPPYSPRHMSWGQEPFQERPRAPADILNLGSHHKEERSGRDLESGKFKFLVGPDTAEKGLVESPDTSPNALPTKALIEASELDGDILKPLESRKGTESEVAVGSPDPLGIYPSKSASESTSSRSFTDPPPKVSARRPSLIVKTEDPRRDLSMAWELTTLEGSMDELKGVRISFYKSKSRISYPVTRIESMRDNQTRRRYIVIKPPVSSNVEFYLFPRSERLVPHSEHPEAYGSADDYRVKFIEPCLLSSQKLSASREGSDASTMAMTPMTPMTTASSAASNLSLASIGSPVLAAMTDASFKEESRRQEYGFEKEDDYRCFQELLMGQGVKLQLQVPVQLITFARYNEGKPSKQSELQYLRLWQSGQHQYVMFFCNATTGKYREYKIENFRPVEWKSKTVVRLDVHLPGMIRRDSKSKSPTIIAEHPTQGQAPEVGLTREIDVDDLRTLDSITIKFTSAEGKAAFLREASFHGLRDDPLMSPLSLQPRSFIV